MESKHTSKSTRTSIDVEKASNTQSIVSTMESNMNWTPSRQVKLIVLGQILVVFAISLDMTILTATLPTVARALHADGVKTFWIASSYLLANAVVQPLMAALADVFGRRGVIFTALVLFTLGSIICAVADNVGAMLAGRVIQGIGGGGILSLNLIIISDVIPLRFRGKYNSLLQLCVSVGFNIAPIIGSLLVKHTTWRWLFYINLPFCAIGLAIIPFVLRYQRPESTINEKISSIDWTGSTIFIIGITTFLIGITWGGTQFAWDSAATLVPIIAGLAAVFMIGLYEKYRAKPPFLRLSVFSTWSAAAIYACTVLQALTLFAELYFLVLYLMAVKMYSPLQSATYLLAFTVCTVPTSGIIGPIITRTGRFRWAIWSGWLITTLALGVLTILDVNTPTAHWVLMFIAAGIGQGLLFIAHSMASQAACQSSDAAHAASMYSFMRSFGLCLGVALGGTIFSNFLAHKLLAAGVDPATAKHAESYIPALRAMAESPLKHNIVNACTWAFQRLFATMCGLGGLGLVISCFIQGHTLDQELRSGHVLKSGQRSSEV